MGPNMVKKSIFCCFWTQVGEKFSNFGKVSMSSDRSWHAEYDKNILTVCYSTFFSRKSKKTKSGVHGKRPFTKKVPSVFDQFFFVRRVLRRRTISI